MRNPPGAPLILLAALAAAGCDAPTGESTKSPSPAKRSAHGEKTARRSPPPPTAAGPVAPGRPEVEALTAEVSAALPGELLQDLRAKPTQQKMERLLTVPGAPRAEAAEIVASYLEHESPFVRMAAVHALEKHADIGRAFAPRMVPLLHHRDPDVRWNALEALGTLGNPDVAAAVAKRTGDKVGRVRWMAGRTLGNLGDPSYASEVAALLWDPDESAHLEAAVALGKLTGEEWRLWTPHVVDKARVWWKEHEDDERFRR